MQNKSIRAAVTCLFSLFCVSGFLVFFAPSAIAQSGELNKDKGLDVRLFRPAVDSKGFISLNGSDILGHKEYSFGLVLDMGMGIFPFTGFEWDKSAGTNATGDNHYKKTDHLVDTALTGTLHF